MRAALMEEFSVAHPRDVPVHGRTDRAIGGSLLTVSGIEDVERNWQRLCRAYLEQLLLHLPQKRGRVLSGARNLLEDLRRRKEVTLGLLTGNVREAARIKLEYFDLFDYFAFGGFGDLHARRDDVALEALEAARRHHDGEFTCDEVWVVGDTPKDIECARAIHANAAGVATGIYSLQQLESAGANLLLADLANPLPFLKLLPPLQSRD